MKKALSLIVGAALVLSMFAGCTPKETAGTPAPGEGTEGNASFTAGTYTATVNGNNGELTVSVTVSEDAITDIQIGENVETYHLMHSAGPIMVQRILDAQSLAVDTVSGATITTGAILSAVKKCVEQAGGDMTALTVKPEPAAPTAETIDCDVVVVGAGLAGLTAANRLLSEGFNVVVLEQLDITGGTTRYAGGSMFGRMQLDDEYDHESLLAAYGVARGETTGTYPNIEKLDGMIDGMEDTFAFYQSLGFDVGYQSDDAPLRVIVRDESVGISAIEDETGYVWCVSLQNAFTNRGGQLLLGTKAVGLRTEDGAVVGVDAETKTGTLTINAKYTIMASGSAAGNQELLSLYCPIKADGEVNQSSKGSSGEGIAMMLELGAVPYEDWDGGLGIPTTMPAYGRSNRDFMSPLANANALYVDYDGVRQTKETTGRLFTADYQIAGKPDAYFTIYDSALAESLGFVEDLETGLSGNSTHFFKADTLEELAELAGFDKDTFLATIEEYNGYCETGVDKAFGKDAEFLNAIAEGPFYAVKHELVHLDVVGGVQTSTAFEVIDANGEPIPGLYAAGGATARDLIGNAGGSNFAVAAYTSRIAAESIIDLLK